MPVIEIILGLIVLVAIIIVYEGRRQIRDSDPNIHRNLVILHSTSTDTESFARTSFDTPCCKYVLVINVETKDAFLMEVKMQGPMEDFV